MSSEVSGYRFPKKQIMVGGAVIASMVGVAALWFYLINSLRIKELNYRLKSATDQTKSVRTSSLVSRYKLLTTRENQDFSSYNKEGRIMQILADSAYLTGADDLSHGERIAKLTVDFFDFLSGSPEFKHEKNTAEYRLLEKAFYHEITRSYAEAISQYDQLLKSKRRIEAQKEDYILLHRGFCAALSGDRSAAIRDLEAVIASRSEAEFVTTAQELLAIISSVDKEIRKIDAMPLSVEKGAAYYEHTAYDQAIATLEKVKADSNPLALYYLGRSLEEKGKSAEAVGHYRKLIVANPNGEVSKKANRRLYALGAFYAAGKEYRQESTSNIQKGIVRDTELLADAQRFEKVSERIDVGEKKVVAELIAPANQSVENLPTKAVQPPVIEKKKNPIPIAQVNPEESSRQPVPRAKEEPREIKQPPVETKPPGPDWDKLEKLSRAEKIKYIGKQKTVERILLENGSQFKGLLIYEDKETIAIFTMLGRIDIEKANIDSREKILQ